MNTRIQELADQAKSQVPQGILSPDAWIEQYNQILGRLIIQECVTVMHEQETLPAGFLYAKSASTHETAILKHFGVE